MQDIKCQGRTKANERCSLKAKTRGYCFRHINQEEVKDAVHFTLKNSDLSNLYMQELVRLVKDEEGTCRYLLNLPLHGGHDALARLVSDYAQPEEDVIRYIITEGRNKNRHLFVISDILDVNDRRPNLKVLSTFKVRIHNTSKQIKYMIMSLREGGYKRGYVSSLLHSFLFETPTEAQNYCKRNNPLRGSDLGEISGFVLGTNCYIQKVFIESVSQPIPQYLFDKRRY